MRFARTGGPDVLEVLEVAEPQAGPGQVRVAVRAAGLNPYDSKVRSGAIPTVLPAGQGMEFAGVIDQIGDGSGGLGGSADAAGAALDATEAARTMTVRDGDGNREEELVVGSAVLGWTMAAAQSDFVVVDRDRVARKPLSLDWPTAGGIGLVANTARRATSSLRLRRGDVVLVTGAGGGVGLLSAQFARRDGAIVVGTAREADHDFLTTIGVIPVAYGPGELDRLRAVSSRYSAALDNVGRAGVLSALALGIEASRVNSVADRAAGAEFGISIVGGGKKTPTELAGFARATASGELLLPIHSTFPLADVVAAYTAFETGHVLGKVVLTAP